MKVKIYLFVLVFLGLASFSVAFSQELSGFGLDRTRVVFPEGEENGVIFTLNNFTNTDYLIQSLVAPAGSDIVSPLPAEAENASPPFIVIPPLVRLDSHGRHVFRIIRKEGTLPKDRESVFTLIVKGIPNTPTNKATEEQGVLRLAVAVNTKFFYRPTGLPADGVNTANKTLRFTRVASGIRVSNSSPFYLTFAYLKVGEAAVPPTSLHLMVAPFGQQVYALPTAKGTGAVRWRLINERGELTPEQKADLQ